MYLRDLNGFLERQRRQYAWEPTGKHGLAGSRRTYQEEVVSSGGGNLEGSLRELLPPHLHQVEVPGRVTGQDASVIDLGGIECALSQEKLQHGGEARGTQDFDPVHDRGLPGVGLRENERLDPSITASGGNGKPSPDWPQATVQTQLSNEASPLHSPLRKDPHADEHTERDRKIEGASLFWYVRRGKVDGDAPLWHRMSSIGERRHRALPPLTDGPLRQADHDEGWKPNRNVDLHRHRMAFDPTDRRRSDLCQHDSSGQNARALARR